MDNCVQWVTLSSNGGTRDHVCQCSTEAAARPTNQAKNKDIGQRPFPQCFGQTFESWDAIVTGYTATGLPSKELTHLGSTHSGGSVLQPIPFLCFTCSPPAPFFLGFIFLSLQTRLVQVSSLVPNAQYNPLSPGVWRQASLQDTASTGLPTSLQVSVSGFPMLGLVPFCVQFRILISTLLQFDMLLLKAYSKGLLPFLAHSFHYTAWTHLASALSTGSLSPSLS